MIKVQRWFILLRMKMEMGWFEKTTCKKKTFRKKIRGNEKNKKN